MLITIDTDNPTPIFDQVAGSVRADILAGVLAPGDRLPAARDVASALEINVHTVLRAYQELRDEGLVDLRRGRGAVIAATAAPLVELASDIKLLAQRARALGVSPTTLSSLMKEAIHD